TNFTVTSAGTNAYTVEFKTDLARRNLAPLGIGGFTGGLAGTVGTIIDGVSTETVAGLGFGVGLGASGKVGTGSNTLALTGNISLTGQGGAAAGDGAQINGQLDLGTALHTASIQTLDTGATSDLIINAAISGGPNVTLATNAVSGGTVELGGPAVNP